MSLFRDYTLFLKYFTASLLFLTYRKACALSPQVIIGALHWERQFLQSKDWGYLFIISPGPKPPILPPFNPISQTTSLLVPVEWDSRRPQLLSRTGMQKMRKQLARERWCFQSPGGDKRLSPCEGRKAVRGVGAEMALHGKLLSGLAFQARRNNYTTRPRVRKEDAECQECRQRALGT